MPTFHYCSVVKEVDGVKDGVNGAKQHGVKKMQQSDWCSRNHHVKQDVYGVQRVFDLARRRLEYF